MGVLEPRSSVAFLPEMRRRRARAPDQNVSSATICEKEVSDGGTLCFLGRTVAFFGLSWLFVRL